jgi:hypothetical protein
VSGNALTNTPRGVVYQSPKHLLIQLSWQDLSLQEFTPLSTVYFPHHEKVEIFISYWVGIGK